MRSEIELLINGKGKNNLGHLRTLIKNPYHESNHVVPNLCKYVTGGITFPHFTTPYYIYLFIDVCNFVE